MAKFFSKRREYFSRGGAEARGKFENLVEIYLHSGFFCAPAPQRETSSVFIIRFRLIRAGNIKRGEMYPHGRGKLRILSFHLHPSASCGGSLQPLEHLSERSVFSRGFTRISPDSCSRQYCHPNVDLQTRGPGAAVPQYIPAHNPRRTRAPYRASPRSPRTRQRS
jgi:hypothetical protein